MTSRPQVEQDDVGRAHRILLTAARTLTTGHAAWRGCRRRRRASPAASRAAVAGCRRAASENRVRRCRVERERLNLLPRLHGAGRQIAQLDAARWYWRGITAS